MRHSAVTAITGRGDKDVLLCHNRAFAGASIMYVWLNQVKSDLVTLRPVALSFFVVLLAGGVALTVHRNYLQDGLLAGLVLGPIFAPMVARWKNNVENVVSASDTTLYIEGKLKRYSLLFSVNGGAFVIAKLIGGEHPPGGLSMIGLSTGAVMFTLLMTADIWLWGSGMREQHGTKLFRPVGQTILLMISALLSSGWILVGAGSR